MKKYLFLSSLLILALGAIKLHSECIDETTTTTYGKSCSNIVCDSYHDGQCIDFHCEYNSYSDKTTYCRESCDLKECRFWEESETDTGEGEEADVCCRFDVASGGSCLDRCATLTKGVKEVRRRCPSPVCNKVAAFF